jgi:hypothetical protein
LPHDAGRTDTTVTGTVSNQVYYKSYPNDKSRMLEGSVVTLTNMTVKHDGTNATITLSGPDNGFWFGVGP